MNSKPVISIVLGTFNRLPFLQATIKNIVKHRIDVPYEIIVIDGGSTDNTIEWLINQKNILSIIQHNRGDDNKPRKSWGYFMNLGFKNARGKYVLMLSDDCLLIPGSVMNAYRLFEEKLSTKEKIGAVAFYWRDWPIEEKYHVNVPLNWSINVNHGMYLKEVLDEVDYIDEASYQFYCADNDLSCRIKQTGYEVIACPTALVEHFAHANREVRMSNSPYRIADSETFFNKWDKIVQQTGHTLTTLSYLEYNDSYQTYTQFPEDPTKPPPVPISRKIQVIFASVSLFIRSNLARIKHAGKNLLSRIIKR